MGKIASIASDEASILNGGILSAVGTSAPTAIKHGYFNFSLWGTFSGTVSLERSFDGGDTWLNASATSTGNPNSFTAPCSIVAHEPERGMLYRVNCTQISSGSINWRISQ